MEQIGLLDVDVEAVAKQHGPAIASVISGLKDIELMLSAAGDPDLSYDPRRRLELQLEYADLLVKYEELALIKAAIDATVRGAYAEQLVGLD